MSCGCGIPAKIVNRGLTPIILILGLQALPNRLVEGYICA
jgi:hypothetical protein